MICYAIHHRVFGPLVAYYADSFEQAMHKFAADPEIPEFSALCAENNCAADDVIAILCDPETVNCEVKE